MDENSPNVTKNGISLYEKLPDPKRPLKLMAEGEKRRDKEIDSLLYSLEQPYQKEEKKKKKMKIIKDPIKKIVKVNKGLQRY